ncbi:LacI family transcriptional regulator [Spirochaetia bacterium]|nr:LacI family transcriptional regulator [Spirochaetia bacterium]
MKSLAGAVDKAGHNWVFYTLVKWLYIIKVRQQERIMIGMKDIAAAAGVSVSTVSNALNNKPNVGEAVRIRIVKLCDEMNYRPRSETRNLSSGRNRTILFDFSDFDRCFYLKLIEGINDYAGDNGYDLLMCTAKSCEKYIRNGLTDGCIILDDRMGNETIRHAAQKRYPFVLLDRILPEAPIKSLVINNYTAMTELLEGLLQRGYRDFAFIGGPEYTNDTRERFEAYTDVLSKHGIPIRRDTYFSGDYSEASGYQAVTILLLAEKPPEVLVCANDNMAIGVIRALTERGCRVPEDVAVTGFDNGERAEALGLTTVAVPNYERGYLAARSLIENINGKNNFEPLRISATVIWRKTVSDRKTV